MSDELLAGLKDAPETRAIVQAVLEIWPDHAGYLARSFAARTPAQMATTEHAAAASRRLMDGRLRDFAEGYRWTCDRLREEELFFHREGRYRLATFAEAEAEVYARPDYMGPYVMGLLLTQILWFNHVGTLDMYLNRVLAERAAPFDYLEIGPGHGLMVYFTTQNPQARSVSAWDVSATSLAETRAALDALGVDRPVALEQVDILAAAAPERQFDLVVISEVLEHLEDPARACAFLRQAMRPDGRIFLNVPVNSPSPDHIYLFAHPDEVVAIVEEAGFRVEARELYATQGRPIDKALKNRISVSVGLIARPA